MKTLGSIISVIVGLFVLYLIGGFVWGILNMQLCSSNLPKNPTCEQIAKNDAENCEYVILKWKKVDYRQELKKCQDWEREQQK